MACFFSRSPSSEYIRRLAELRIVKLVLYTRDSSPWSEYTQGTAGLGLNVHRDSSPWSECTQGTAGLSLNVHKGQLSLV